MPQNDNQMPLENRMDRRQFAGSLATASGVVTALLVSQPSLAEDRPPAVVREGDQPLEANERPAKPSPEILLLTYLSQQYPSDHFNETTLQGIYGDIRGDHARGRVLSEFPLKNSDEPGFVFQVYRGPE